MLIINKNVEGIEGKIKLVCILTMHLTVVYMYIKQKRLKVLRHWPFCHFKLMETYLNFQCIG